MSNLSKKEYNIAKKAEKAAKDARRIRLQKMQEAMYEMREAMYKINRHSWYDDYIDYQVDCSSSVMYQNHFEPPGTTTGCFF